jgi:glycosyltransferase involved in cell wall biosynthesis
VPKLCEALANLGITVELHVLAPFQNHQGKAYSIHTHPAWPIISHLGISPKMYKELKRLAPTTQIIHNHSLWMLPNIYPAFAIKGTNCRLVTSPRGTLSEYALGRSRWLKKIVLHLGQKAVLNNAHCIHATSEFEFKDIRQKGLKNPVAIIPNGIEIPNIQKEEGSSPNKKRLLYLGRIHPIKGIDILLRAWGALEKNFPDWELSIVGPDNDGYLYQMQNLAKDLNIEKVTFTGPVYGLEKCRVYQSTDLFVLPTHSENFGMAVAEALAYGIPAIVSKGAPWNGLEMHGCGWWIEIGERPLTECLREVLTLSPKELAKRGALGKTWIENNFSWTRVGKMMHETYLWILGGGKPPDWVRMD